MSRLALAGSAGSEGSSAGPSKQFCPRLLTSHGAPLPHACGLRFPPAPPPPAPLLNTLLTLVVHAARSRGSLGSRSLFWIVEAGIGLVVVRHRRLLFSSRQSTCSAQYNSRRLPVLLLCLRIPDRDPVFILHV